MSDTYVHGYEAAESERLHDQAGALADLLNHDTAYAPRSVVLEVGCGVGAQTVTLARRSPGAHFVSVDVSAESLTEAKRRCELADVDNVEFRTADVLSLPFGSESFDHVFVCFVLEHLRNPRSSEKGTLDNRLPLLVDHGTVINQDLPRCADRGKSRSVEVRGYYQSGMPLARSPSWFIRN